jgi:DNA-binding beta-propeller fold protein YncE
MGECRYAIGMSPRLVLLLVVVVVLAGVALTLGLGGAGFASELVWGAKGMQPGMVSRPRAIAIDPKGRLFLVDFTARIQTYDLDGNHLGHTWTPPDFRNGRPSGLSIDRDGNLIVSDSHYNRVRVYTFDGKELKVIGGEAGTGPGQLGYVSDCVQDEDGFYYIAEFGANARISKFDVNGGFVKSWGSLGQGPLQFNRVRALAIGPDGLLYAVDACNHRIQVMTRDGEFVREFGGAGREPGRFNLPYDLSFGPDGHLYVVERGNCRVQKLTAEGVPVATWGEAGRDPGQLADPWAVAVDKSGRVHVVDTENHRVQRVKF